MNFYNTANDWDEGLRPPNTSQSAKPLAPLKVNGPVITVKNAYYRTAIFSGSFLLAETPDNLKRNGKQRVKVYCLWFGCRTEKVRSILSR